MRNRRGVFNIADFDASRSQSANCRLASRARAADSHFNAAHAVIARHVGGVRRGLLRGKRRAFTRSAEAERARTLPGQNVARLIGDGHNRVVERRLDVAMPNGTCLRSFFLNVFFLPFFSGAAAPVPLPAAAGFAIVSL